MSLYLMIDEQDRLSYIKAEDSDNKILSSHTFSYMYQRKMYQELGDTMGLDRIMEEK